jgi:hypothetical protein
LFFIGNDVLFAVASVQIYLVDLSQFQEVNAMEKSHPLGNHVSPVPAILHRVPRRNVRTSGWSLATPAKQGISTTADHVEAPERRSTSVGRR